MTSMRKKTWGDKLREQVWREDIAPLLRAGRSYYANKLLIKPTVKPRSHVTQAARDGA